MEPLDDNQVAEMRRFMEKSDTVFAERDERAAEQKMTGYADQFIRQGLKIGLAVTSLTVIWDGATFRCIVKGKTL